MTDPSSLPYRLNVGAVLFGADNRVLVARRAGLADAAWQLPQGGIDPGEDPRTAIFRELEEEIGTAHADILAEHPDWLHYDLPPELIGKAFRGRYRGQRQKWFALRFLGTDAEIRLDAHATPEFDAWKWVELEELPALAVAFKRPIYERLVRDFAPCIRPGL
jgi:putative (di)nucleoside polyphosphate hydrolase